MTVKAYSYIRYSSKPQARGDSLRRQLKLANDWASAHPEIELDTETRDAAVSAFKGLNRIKGALASFRQRVESGAIPRGSYLLIENFDRLSREHEQVAALQLLNLTQAGIRVVTLVDGAIYDDKTDLPDLLRALIIMSRAHEEIKTRTERVRKAWGAKKDRARKTGEVLTRRGPAWTRFNEETRKFEVIEERANVVRRIFQLCVDGMGGTAIAATLNADEHTKTAFGKANGWHSEYIVTMLHSRSVIGEYQANNTYKQDDGNTLKVPDGDPIKDYYPKIVDEETFLRAQAIIAHRNKRGKGRGRRGKSFPNLLIGLAKCEECSGTLIIGNRPNSPQVRFLRCYTASRNHGCTNKRKYLCENIEQKLMYFLEYAGFGEEQSDPANDIKLQTKRDALLDLQKRITSLIDMIEDGGNDVRDRLKSRQAEREVLIAEIRAIENEAITAKTEKPVRMLVEDYRIIFDQMQNTTGADLYALRTKMNAILSQMLEFVVPFEDGTFYAIGTDRVGYIAPANDVPIMMRSRSGKPVTLEALRVAVSKGYRAGTVSDFEIARSVRNSSAT